MRLSSGRASPSTSARSPPATCANTIRRARTRPRRRGSTASPTLVGASASELTVAALILQHLPQSVVSLLARLISAVLAACPQLVEPYIDAEQSILSSIANLELPHLRTLGLAYPTTISHHVKPAFDIIYLAPAVLGQPGLTKLILYDMRAGASDSTATFQALRSHPTLQQIELQRCTIGDHQTSPGPAAYAPIIRPRELGTLISDGSPSMAVAVALAFSPRSLVLTGPGAAGDVALGCARRSALRFVHLSREGQTLLPTLANNPSITTLSLGLIVDPYSHHDHGGFGRAIATQISADGALHGLKRVVFRVAPAVLASEATREGFFVGTALSIRAAAVLRGVKWAMVADDVDWSTYIQRCEDERLYEPTAAAVSPEPYSPASPAHISAPSPTSSIAEDDLMAQ